MASSNVYAVEPALPVLAHSLLDQTSRSSNKEQPTGELKTDSTWNLQEDWSEGIQASGSRIFRYGTVIGFSRLRTRANNNDEYVAEVSHRTKFSATNPSSHTSQIPRRLVVNHLQRTIPSVEPSTFIIYPESFTAFAPITLLKALQRGETGLSQAEAMKRLDSVQLFPIHHFSTAVQAIGQITEQLQQIQEKREADCEPISHNHGVILIVVGLDSLAEAIIRASNPLKGNAVLSSTLRNLTRISRAYSSVLSILLLNTSGIGPAYSPQEPQMGQHRGAIEETRSSGDEGVYSIFQAPGSPLLSNMLMRTLDQGIDTHILLSDVKSAHVAEVIKDRSGPGIGKWGLWSFQQ